jgi:hypothetical protein
LFLITLELDSNLCNENDVRAFDYVYKG